VSDLRFRDDGTFTIVQFTDVHWHNGEPDDFRTRQVMETVLDLERPDLVVLTGDFVGGYDSRDPDQAMREVVVPMVSRGLPWAAVFGNHDDEGALSRLELLAVQQSQPGCLTVRGPESLTGVGNYVLRVAGRKGALGAVLYCLDSNSYAPEGLGTYAWIARDQIAWYLETSKALQAEYAQRSRPERLPALAFFHIPLIEYDDVWDLQECRGHRLETACPPSLNSGFFAALVESGDVMGTFAGHDHVNDYEGELMGIRLCYGRGTGVSCYGADGFLRGGRVIRLREGEHSFETWVRLSDGSAPAPPLHQPTGRTHEEGIR
jgi:hypothetical protein